MYNPAVVAERIKEYAKSQKVSVGQMLEECELNKNVLSTMLSRGSMPKADNIARIADYLDCSVDYLLGRTDNPKAHLAPADVEYTSVAADLEALQKEFWEQRIAEFKEKRAEERKRKIQEYRDGLIAKGLYQSVALDKTGDVEQSRKLEAGECEA